MIRYRSEIPFGSGERSTVDVLTYEVFDLGNFDILIDLCEGVNVVCPNVELLDRIGVRSIVQDAVQKLEKLTGFTIPFCLWLADKDVVLDYYGQGQLTEDDIDAYEISEIVLCDLGYDGALYGYKEEPKPIDTNHKVNINLDSPGGNKK